MNPSNIALWLLGNLTLAYIPVALAVWLVRGLRGDLAVRGRVRWLLWSPLLLLWLLFLPNTCYLLTEWRHYLNSVSLNPAFYPIYHRGEYPPAATFSLLSLTTFYVVYSGLGLLALFLSVRSLSSFAVIYWGQGHLWRAQAGIFLLCAVGVYLGLVNRFNSWDILRLHTAYAIFHTLAGLVTRPALDLFLLGFAAMLWLSYVLFDIWMDGALTRLRARSRSV